MQIDGVTYPTGEWYFTVSASRSFWKRDFFFAGWLWEFGCASRGDGDGMFRLCSAITILLSLSPLKLISVGFVLRSKRRYSERTGSARGSIFSRPKICRVAVWLPDSSLGNCWGYCDPLSRSNPRPAKEMGGFLVLVLILGFVCHTEIVCLFDRGKMANCDES